MARKLGPVRKAGPRAPAVEQLGHDAREHALGRPVLIGTRSVEDSENLSAALDAAGITETREARLEALLAAANAGQGFGQVQVGKVGDIFGVDHLDNAVVGPLVAADKRG